jgi:hypothetical protein
VSVAFPAAAGWLAFGLVPLGAALGWITRRLSAGPLRTRMRPHYVAGYAALGFALVHVGTSMGSMAGADATGVWLATLALLGLIWQALLGSNLQSPGYYRKPLRRWHLVTFAAVVLFAGGHVLINR